MTYSQEKINSYKHTNQIPNQQEVERVIFQSNQEKQIDLLNPLIANKTEALEKKIENHIPQKTAEQIKQEIDEQATLQKTKAKEEWENEVKQSANSLALPKILATYGVDYTIEPKNNGAIWGVSLPTSAFDRLKETRRLMRRANQDTEKITTIIKIMRRERRNDQTTVFIPLDNFTPTPFVLENYLSTNHSRKSLKEQSPKTSTADQETCTDDSCDKPQHNKNQKEELTGAKKTNLDMLMDRVTNLTDGSEHISCNGKRYIRNGSEILKTFLPAAAMLRGGYKLLSSLWSKEKGKAITTGLGFLAGGFLLGETNFGGKELKDIFSGNKKIDNAKEEAENSAEKESKKFQKEQNASKGTIESKEETQKRLYKPMYTQLTLGWLPFSEMHHYLTYDTNGEIIGLDRLDLLKEKVQLDSTLTQNEKDLRMQFIDELINNPSNKTLALQGFKEMGITRGEIEKGMTNQKEGSIAYRYYKYANNYKAIVMEQQKEQLGLQTELSIEQQKIMLEQLQKNLNDPSVGKIIKKDGYILIEKDGKLLSSAETSGFLLGNLFGQSWVVGEQVIINTATGTGLFLGGFRDGFINQGKKTVAVTTIEETGKNIQQYLNNGYEKVIENGRRVLKKSGEETIDIAQKMFKGDYAYALGEGLIAGGAATFNFIGEALFNIGEFAWNNTSGLAQGLYEGVTK